MQPSEGSRPRVSEFNYLSLMAVLFLVQHLGIPSSGLRRALVGAFGERIYVGLYSLVSLVLIVLLVRAYNDAPLDPLWSTYEWMRLAAVIVMPVAFFLLIGGLLNKNPTTVGVVLEDSEEVPVSGVMRITRHPVQFAILLWALTHMLVNGDSASLVFFGVIGLVSGYGMLLIDRRKREVIGERWEAFREATSIIPFAAILGGRQSLDIREIGWPVLALSLVGFLAFWWGHYWVSGMSVGVVW